MSSGSQRRELLGLITCRSRYVSQSEIKKDNVLIQLGLPRFIVIDNSHLYTNEFKQI